MSININTIKILLIVSLLGSFGSGIYIGANVDPNTSWSYYLTKNPDEQNSVTSISDDGNYFVIGSGNDRLYLFSRNNSKPLWIWRSNDDIYSVDISGDSNFILAGDSDITARLFERNSATPIWDFNSGTSGGRVAISSDGEYSAVCSFYKLYLYQRSLATLLIDGANAGDHVKISSQGDFIVSFNFMGGIIYLFNKFNSVPIWLYNTGDVLYDLAITPTGEFIVTGGQAYDSSGFKLFLFNSSSSTPKIMYTESVIRAVAISQDGDYIAAGCPDGIYLFNSSNLTKIWKYSFPIYGDTHTIAMSDNGDYIVANLWRDPLDGEINRILIFNKVSNTTITVLETESMVNDIAISSDGNHISVATQQRAYYINLKNPNIPNIDNPVQIKPVIISLSTGATMGVVIFGILIYFIKFRKH
ncbi:MAG: WD40 repeat domain-containing protein [Candidatus Hermodarchaeota archaeon]